MKIDDEIIERLTMDRVCGELGDDAAVLLEAWLDTDHAAGQKAEKITETYRLAESAMEQKAEVMRRRGAASSRSMSVLAKMSRFRPYFIQAAAVLVALGVGLWAGRLTDTVNKGDLVSSVPFEIAQPKTEGSAIESLMDKEGFWRDYLLASMERNGGSGKFGVIGNREGFWPDINQLKERYKND